MMVAGTRLRRTLSRLRPRAALWGSIAAICRWPNMQSNLPTHLLTRSQLHDFLVQQGFPIGKSTLDKQCAPACGEGPPVAALWPGRGKNRYRPLYEAAAALEWVKSLLSPAPSNQTSLKAAAAAVEAGATTVATTTT